MPLTIDLTSEKCLSALNSRASIIASIYWSVTPSNPTSTLLISLPYSSILTPPLLLIRKTNLLIDLSKRRLKYISLLRKTLSEIKTEVTFLP